MTIEELLEENKNLKEQLDKVTAERDTLKADNLNFKNIVKDKDKHYLPILVEKNKRIKELEEKLYNRDNKQISLEV